MVARWESRLGLRPSEFMGYLASTRQDGATGRVAHEADPSAPPTDASLAIGRWTSIGIGELGLVVGAVAGGLALA